MENAQPEPSMEEILASIRRIISEDEEEVTPAVTKTAPIHETANQIEERIALVDDTPDVTGAAPKAQSSASPLGSPSGQSPVSPSAPPKTHVETENVDMIKQNTTEAMDLSADDTILNETTAAAASQAFRNLSESVRISSGEGNTLEDVVVQMLKPMIQDWLNQNLPTIVEQKVEEEVQRLARRRG